MENRDSKPENRPTPKEIREELRCPPSCCNGRLLGVVRYQLGDVLTIETVCPQRKRDVLIFKFGSK